MDLKEALRFIKTADADDMDLITRATNVRNTQLRADRRFEMQKLLKLNDAVRITSNIKPKYMAGKVGTFDGDAGDYAWVVFPKPIRRFGSRVRVPYTSIEKVNA